MNVPDAKGPPVRGADGALVGRAMTTLSEAGFFYDAHLLVSGGARMARFRGSPCTSMTRRMPHARPTCASF